MFKERSGGVLLHITSLPNDYSIGSMGSEAHRFIDFLCDAGMKYWQMLPLNMNLDDSSPYDANSSIAKNIYLISYEKLFRLGLISEMPKKTASKDKTRIDFKKAYPLKAKVLRKAHKKFLEDQSSKLYLKYLNWCEENDSWLDDFSLYAAIKETFAYRRKADNRLDDMDEYISFVKWSNKKIRHELQDKFFFEACWISWPEKLKNRDEKTLNKYRKLLANKISFYKFTQFVFALEWEELHAYAKEKNITLIGDMPFFVNYDSADVWCHPELFDLNREHIPNKIAGVPPDYFSTKGQLWRNPLYNWKEMNKQNYKWWKERFEHLYRCVDYVRLDHFRAFDKYWAIPYFDKDATKGKWLEGPGENFFKILFERRNLPLIAEDLGQISKSVEALRDSLNMPGMFVSQFHLLSPKMITQMEETIPERILYTGTHDNSTVVSYLKYLNEEKKTKLRKVMHKKQEEINNRSYIEFVASLPYKVFILPMQDILGQDDKSRMNVPGTTDGNWGYRIEKGDLNYEVRDYIHKLLADSNRLIKPKLKLIK